MTSQSLKSWIAQQFQELGIPDEVRVYSGFHPMTRTPFVDGFFEVFQSESTGCWFWAAIPSLVRVAPYKGPFESAKQAYEDATRKP